MTTIASPAVDPPRRRATPSPATGVLTAAAVVTAVTLLLYPLQDLDPGVSSGVLYVLGVLGIAVTWGLRLGLATSVASALCLWVFHTSPGAGLSPVEAEDVVAISVLLITCVVGTVIADRARQRADEAEARAALEVERVRLQEVQASRARVLAAGDEERRRVVRDLHDGAQQRLVHTVVTLKLAGRAEGEEARALVGDALAHAEAAIAELRELAHGILPSVLSRGGLRAGVEALADRMPIPVALDVTDERFDATAEATAYFVIAEALTNVAKHAGATRATVRARREGDRLVLSVDDDGRGGARADGSGLTGLQDRLSVLDGTLAVGPGPSGTGTRLSAALPLAEVEAYAERALRR
jgi:signal transduction histidine kinase